MAIAVVQHASAVKTFTSGATGTISPAFTADTAAGNCLVAVFSISNQDATSGVVDGITSVTTNGAAENWAQAITLAIPDGAPTQLWIYVNPATGGDQKIVDVNIDFGTDNEPFADYTACCTVDIYEVSGAAASSPVDQTASALVNNVDTWTSGAAGTTAYPSEIAIGAACWFYWTANTMTTVTGPASPWVNEATLDSTVQLGGTGTADRYYHYQKSGYDILAATGTPAYAGTSAVALYGGAAIVTLKAAGAATVTGQAAQAIAPAQSAAAEATSTLSAEAAQAETPAQAAGALVTGTLSFGAAQALAPSQTAGAAVPGGPIPLPAVPGAAVPGWASPGDPGQSAAVTLTASAAQAVAPGQAAGATVTGTLPAGAAQHLAPAQAAAAGVIGTVPAGAAQAITPAQAAAATVTAPSSSTYTSTYPSVYGGSTVTPVFPFAPLDVAVELDLAGTWTDVTTYAMQREGTSPPITIQRGRPSETSQATPSSANFQLNNRNGNFSPRNPSGEYYGQLAVRNNPVRISVPDDTTYLRFADDDQSYISCPDSSALHLTADFDLRLDMWLDDWQPCTLAGKWGGSTELWAWCLTLNGDGTVSLIWYDGGSVSTAQSTQPLPYLGRIMVRVFFEAGNEDDPTCNFWTAPDMAGAQTQLGSPVTIDAEDFAQAATTQPVQVGYVDGFLGQSLPSGNSGCLGKVYELQMYDASHDLVADPQFYNATAGASSFADAQGNTWTVEGTASLSARSFRAHLECSSLPQQWDETGTDVWTPVGASGILRRLQQGNSPIWSVMRRGITSTIASVWGVLAYWPCEDFAGSLSIASGLAGGSPMLFSGAPAFQGTAGSLSADSVFACSAQLVQPSSSTWSFNIPRHTLQTAGDTVYFLLSVDSGGISADCTLLALNYAGGQQITITYATATGGSLGVSGPGILIDGPANVNGQALWCSFQSNADGITLAVLAAGETVPAAYTGDVGINRTVLSGTVNPGGANLSGTEVGHLWASAAGPSIEGYADLLNAYNGETAAARFSRLCGENSITCRIYGFPDLSAIMGDQEIDTLGNVLQSVEDADRGQIYEPAETLGLGYRTVHSLCAQSPAITLDYTLGVFGGDGSQGLVPTDDDQFTQNDVTLSRNNGSSYQYQVTEGPMSIQEPPNGAGDYATSLTVYVQADTQLPYIASWMAGIGTCDEERYPSVPVNLARPQLASLIYAIQDVRIGDYVQILNPPSWLPPGDISQLAYGVTEKLGGFFWSLAWNAVPETPYEVAIAGTDASDSAHADTEGSELAGSYDAAATSLSVETTEGPIWTTDGGSGAGQQSIVPLYSYPPSDFWTDVTANAPTMAMIVCNVDSGPGTEYESNFGAVFEAAAAAGITCLGYVPTGYGADTIASIEAQVDLWETYYGIVSINFDTVSPDEAYLSYYEELVGYVHGRGGVAVLNPGSIPAEGMMSIGADVVCVCEDSQANFAADAAAAPSWLFDYPAASIAVTCNQCSTEAEMATVVGLSHSAFNARYCWVVADAIYGAEPSYFAGEVTELGYAPGGGGDFPFDVIIGGEQITVNDITGDSSPQTFSVVRSVNGVSKSQAEGAPVALFHTPIAALT